MGVEFVVIPTGADEDGGLDAFKVGREPVLCTGDFCGTDGICGDAKADNISLNNTEARFDCFDILG